MNFKIQTSILVLVLSFLFSYASEARIAPTPAGSGALDPQVFEVLKTLIPEGEQHLIQFKKRIDETLPTSPSQQCTKLCYALYDKEISDFKTFTDRVSGSTTTDVDFDITVEKAQLDECDVCLRKLGETEPEYNIYAEWFYTSTEKVEELLGKFSS